MYLFSSPSFISFEVSSMNVYSHMINDDINDVADSKVMLELIQYIEQHPPIGLSLYGDMIKVDMSLLYKTCEKAQVQIGYDLECNKNTFSYLEKEHEHFQLYRILIASLNPSINDIFFGNNRIEDSIRFIKQGFAIGKGRVIVIPVLEETVSEVESVIDFALLNGFKANPLPIPTSCALKMGGHPLSRESYYKLAKIVGRYYLSHGDNIYLDMPAAYKETNKPSICPAFRLSIDVSWKGSIRSCKFAEKIYGSIGSLKEIWMKNRGYMPSKCAKCENAELCGGGCIANVHSNSECDIYCGKC